jgi:sugar lactone lactonase YvrE
MLRGCLLAVILAPSTPSGFAAVPASAGAVSATAGESIEVALERVITTRKDLRRGRFLRWLTGRGDPPLFQRPFGVAWDGEDLLVTDPGRGELVRIAADGRVSQTAGELLLSPIGVAACREGIVVSDSLRGRVASLDRDLRLQHWLAEGLERPTGVACDREGRVFIVETARHRVLVLEPVGGSPPASTVSAEAGATRGPDRGYPAIGGGHRLAGILGGRGDAPGRFNFPTVITLGEETVWVGDTLNFRIQAFTAPTGRVTSTFGQIGDSPGEMPRLKGLAVDAGGRVWASDSYLEQVALYSPDGGFLTAFGGRGAMPGDFSFPAGLAAHTDGRVAVVDSFNRRIQIFRLVPRSV